MKNIKIWFSGMDGNFNLENNFIFNVLKKRYNVRISKKPDYLFYSVKSTDYLDFKCIRIFFTAENLVPDFNLCDYAMGFHYLNFGDRYIRFPLYLVDGFIAYQGDDYALDLQRALHKHERAETAREQKSEFCSFVYSNSEAVSCREKLFDALSKYKTVNSGGRYKNNVGFPIDSKLEFQLKHKFVIAFENSSTIGYTTEKIVHAFSADAVPIYWGNPEITQEFRSGSFINCHEFGLTEVGEEETIEKIVNEVKRIDQDSVAYLHIMKMPAFRDECSMQTQEQAFEDFLIHIFEQEISSAYRRNRHYWGERYERRVKIGHKFYLLCRKGIPIRDGILTLLKRR